MSRLISQLAEPMTGDFVDGIAAGVLICVVVLAALWGFAALIERLEKNGTT